MRWALLYVTVMLDQEHTWKLSLDGGWAIRYRRLRILFTAHVRNSLPPNCIRRKHTKEMRFGNIGNKTRTDCGPCLMCAWNNDHAKLQTLQSFMANPDWFGCVSSSRRVHANFTVISNQNGKGFKGFEGNQAPIIRVYLHAIVQQSQCHHPRGLVLIFDVWFNQYDALGVPVCTMGRFGLRKTCCFDLCL